MAVFTDFFPGVRASSPKCPVALSEYFIRQAAIDFCTRTWFWQSALAAVDSVASQGTYSYAQPTDAIVYKLLRARFSGTKLGEANIDQLEALYADWESEEAARPLYITQEASDTYRLVPAPDSVITGAIGLKVVLKPSQACATLPDNLLEDYKQIIVHGALELIKAQTDKPWSALKEVAMHHAKYEEAIGPAKTRAQKGFVRSRRGTKGHFF